MVVEGLNHLTKSAAACNKFAGIEVGWDKRHVTHLQYTDDTLFFGEWNRMNACNLVKILKCFEAASGLKINFHKSCVFNFGVSRADTNLMATWLGCLASSFPITYLGIPIGSSMGKEKEWDPFLRSFIKGLWIGRLSHYHLEGGSRLLNSSGQDERTWPLSPTCVFSIKLLSGLLSQAELGTPAINLDNCTLHNKLVPLKVKLFIWRARHNRLPTRVKLDKRGMDLGTIRCPVCDDGQETVDHSIILCNFSLDIWNRVFEWWNLGAFSHTSINEAFLENGHTFTSDVGKQLWQATE
ncbi:uncharacterized protein [Rutidosis leptorrhynchoides]|uniref:uncharacterized protein n=1 Tax=Rutidosis leptorrhynchoides TaxID=125765 RepID=UPI003A9A021C